MPLDPDHPLLRPPTGSKAQPAPSPQPAAPVPPAPDAARAVPPAPPTAPMPAAAATPPRRPRPSRRGWPKSQREWVEAVRARMNRIGGSPVPPGAPPTVPPPPPPDSDGADAPEDADGEGVEDNAPKEVRTNPLIWFAIMLIGAGLGGACTAWLVFHHGLATDGIVIPWPLKVVICLILAIVLVFLIGGTYIARRNMKEYTPVGDELKDRDAQIELRYRYHELVIATVFVLGVIILTLLPFALSLLCLMLVIGSAYVAAWSGARKRNLYRAMIFGILACLAGAVVWAPIVAPTDALARSAKQLSPQAQQNLLDHCGGDARACINATLQQVTDDVGHYKTLKKACKDSPCKAEVWSAQGEKFTFQRDMAANCAVVKNAAQRLGSTSALDQCDADVQAFISSKPNTWQDDPAGW